MFCFPISDHVMVPLRTVSVSHAWDVGRARVEHHVVEIEKTKDTS